MPYMLNKRKRGPYPADSSSSKITVSTPSAWIALLISETLPEPMYVLGFGDVSLYWFRNWVNK